jgi:hypothetical protein
MSSFGTIVSVTRPRSPSIGSITSVGRRKIQQCEGDCDIVVRKLRDKIDRLENELEVTQTLLKRKESEISFMNEKFNTFNKIATMTPDPSPVMTKICPMLNNALMGN